ncbi:DUF1788 domain-containing protein [Lacticaseibacillus saniviri]
MADLDKDFARLRTKLASDYFQENRGLSNEIGYYIFDYKPQDELRVREFVQNIVSTSTVATIGATIHVFNLFEIVTEILDGFGYTERFMEFEKQYGVTRMITEINNILRMENEQNLVVKYIEDHLPANEKSIIFIVGVGEVFPLLRSHKVLNTMNQVIDKTPVVMFYPGKYDGLHLSMFGELKDDNYYRAFSLRMEWNEHED